MAATRRYDEELRAIGQALEAKDISVFELKQTADNYIIEGTLDQTGSLRSKVRQWLRQLHSRSNTASLALGLADVERLSQAGRAKRSDSERLPSFQSVSSILRTIGAYLDSREVKLLELQKRRISITLLYRDKRSGVYTDSPSRGGLIWMPTPRMWMPSGHGLRPEALFIRAGTRLVFFRISSTISPARPGAAFVRPSSAAISR